LSVVEEVDALVWISRKGGSYSYSCGGGGYCNGNKLVVLAKCPALSLDHTLGRASQEICCRQWLPHYPFQLTVKRSGVLYVRSSELKKHLLVSSKVLSLASPVFAAILCSVLNSRKAKSYCPKYKMRG